jgi:hypothetical protein
MSTPIEQRATASTPRFMKEADRKAEFSFIIPSQRKNRQELQKRCGSSKKACEPKAEFLLLSNWLDRNARVKLMTDGAAQRV